ncbi:MAG TPA: hypothetical protein VG755_30570 [Nannocystaceae bacterium]|nr:hypothetical protein [Nannocystaceae bacterium]
MWLALLSIVARLAEAPAVATPRWVELDWRAPAECPDAEAVHVAIEGMLTAEPERIDPLPRVTAIVERESRGFVLRVRLAARGAERVRELRAGTCTTLVDAVAVEVSLLIARRDRPEALTIASPFARLDYAAPSPTASVPPSPRRSLALSLRAGTLAAAVLPSSFVAPMIGLAVGGRRWSTAIELAVWPGGFAPLPGRTREGARLGLVTATLSGCARWPGTARFALAGCVGLELGALVSRGRGLLDATRATDPSLAIAFTPAIERTLFGPVRVAFGPWLRVGAVRPGVRVDGIGEIHRLPAWTLGGALRLELRIFSRKAAKIPGRTRRVRDI